MNDFDVESQNHQQEGQNPEELNQINAHAIPQNGPANEAGLGESEGRNEEPDEE